MLVCLDADAVRRWCATGLAALRRHQREIDELNVFPVPDGDTGTNLVLTFASAAERLERTPEGDLASTLSTFARGALLGARGNSGVIISELLRGLSSTINAAGMVAADAGQATDVAGRALAIGLAAASRAAYRAVVNPVEGTMLSVARGAAEAAIAAASDDLALVARAAAKGASEALARTPEQLAALARAGVVDAGGRGLVVLLDALVEVITGEPTHTAPLPTRDHAASTQPDATRGDRHGAAPGNALDFAYAFEVQFLLDAADDAVTVLKGALAGLGDSLAMAPVGPAGGGPESSGGLDLPATPELSTWNVHVHVNDVGAVLEAAVAAGRPHRISVTHFATQIAARPEHRAIMPPATASSAATGPDQPDGAPRSSRASVVIAAGAGLAALFEAEGAVVVRGPSPSTGEILAAIRASGRQRIVILPDVAATQAIASAAAAEARAEGVRAAVVPTRSPVQALAALAVRDDGRRFEDDIIAMAEAAGACRYAEVTRASREALTVAGRCQAGDVLALIEGEVNLIGKDLADTCRDLLDRMLAGGGELVTLITGEQATPTLAADLREHLIARWPFVEAQFYDGGQPHHPLLVGVE